MPKRVHIVEIYPDGKFEIIPNEIEMPKELPYAEQIRADLLSDKSPLSNREHCMRLAQNVKSLQAKIKDIMVALLMSHSVMDFSMVFRRINAKLRCKFPAYTVNRILEKVSKEMNIEYVAGRGLIQKETASLLCRQVQIMLQENWCIDDQSVLGILGSRTQRGNTQILETVNVVLGKRGIFSIGHFPVISKDIWKRYVEIEHLFAYQLTGIEDIGLWGSSGIGEEEVYKYTGVNYMDFRFRLYFSAKSIVLFYALVRDYLKRVYNASIIWIAKRFGRSPAESELIIFLLLSKGICFQNGNSLKNQQRIDLMSIREKFGIVWKDRLTLTLKELEERVGKISSSLADVINKEVQQKKKK